MFEVFSRNRCQEVHNEAVLQSDLDWTVAQPVHLTDDQDTSMPFLSTAGETGNVKVSRSSVARFLARAVTSPTYVGSSVAVSGAGAAR